jgi:hypothetical protein
VGAVRSPFAVPVPALAVEHVHAFLAEAEEEGVTWEGKADGPEGRGRLRPEHVRNGVCAFANQIGGHFIVGEPGLWLDRAIAGLRPLPRYQHRVFDLDDGRWAAVIRVEPLTQTPCMTVDGQVFERVSSESVRVTDPLRLAALFTRGEQARGRAEEHGTRALRTLSQAVGQPLGVVVTLGLAAASYDDDIGSRLFHARFRTQLDQAFDNRLFRELSLPTRAPSSEDHAIRQS